MAGLFEKLRELFPKNENQNTSANASTGNSAGATGASDATQAATASVSLHPAIQSYETGVLNTKANPAFTNEAEFQQQYKWATMSGLSKDEALDALAHGRRWKDTALKPGAYLSSYETGHRSVDGDTGFKDDDEFQTQANYALRSGLTEDEALEALANGRRWVELAVQETGILNTKENPAFASEEEFQTQYKRAISYGLTKEEALDALAHGRRWVDVNSDEYHSYLAPQDKETSLQNRSAEDGPNAALKAIDFLNNFEPKGAAAIARQQRRRAKFLDEAGKAAYADNFGGQFQASIMSAELSQRLGEAGFEYMMNPTKENWDYFMELQDTLDKFNARNAEALDDQNVKGRWISQDLARYLPQLADQAEASLISTGITAGAGALGGLVLAGPAGALAGAKMGIKPGLTIGSTAASYTTMFGLAFSDLLQQGYDEQTAARLASDEATVSSIIEGADTILTLTLGTGKLAMNAGKKMLGKAVTKEVSEAVVKSTGKKIFDTLKAYGLEILGEGAEEFTQEIVSIANQMRAADGNTEGGVGELALYVGKALGRMDGDQWKQAGEAARGGAVLGVMTGGVGVGASHVMNRIGVNNAVKLANSEELTKETNLDKLKAAQNTLREAGGHEAEVQKLEERRVALRNQQIEENTKAEAQTVSDEDSSAEAPVDYENNPVTAFYADEDTDAAVEENPADTSTSPPAVPAAESAPAAVPTAPAATPVSSNPALTNTDVNPNQTGQTGSVTSNPQTGNVKADIATTLGLESIPEVVTDKQIDTIVESKESRERFVAQFGHLDPNLKPTVSSIQSFIRSQFSAETAGQVTNPQYTGDNTTAKTTVKENNNGTESTEGADLDVRGGGTPGDVQRGGVPSSGQSVGSGAGERSDQNDDIRDTGRSEGGNGGSVTPDGTENGAGAQGGADVNPDLSTPSTREGANNSVGKVVSRRRKKTKSLNEGSKITRLARKYFRASEDGARSHLKLKRYKAHLDFIYSVLKKAGLTGAQMDKLFSYILDARYGNVFFDLNYGRFLQQAKVSREDYNMMRTWYTGSYILDQFCKEDSSDKNLAALTDILVRSGVSTEADAVQVIENIRSALVTVAQEHRLVDLNGNIATNMGTFHLKGNTRLKATNRAYVKDTKKGTKVSGDIASADEIIYNNHPVGKKFFDDKVLRYKGKPGNKLLRKSTEADIWYDEKKNLYYVVTKKAKGRQPILVGAPTSDYAEAHRLAQSSTNYYMAKRIKMSDVKGVGRSKDPIYFDHSKGKVGMWVVNDAILTNSGKYNVVKQESAFSKDLGISVGRLHNAGTTTAYIELDLSNREDFKDGTDASLYNLLKDGIEVNGKHYIFVGQTANQNRKGIVTFMEESKYLEVREKMLAGFIEEQKLKNPSLSDDAILEAMNPAKFLSYVGTYQTPSNRDIMISDGKGGQRLATIRDAVVISDVFSMLLGQVQRLMITDVDKATNYLLENKAKTFVDGKAGEAFTAESAAAAVREAGVGNILFFVSDVARNITDGCGFVNSTNKTGAMQMRADVSGLKGLLVNMDWKGFFKQMLGEADGEAHYWYNDEGKKVGGIRWDKDGSLWMYDKWGKWVCVDSKEALLFDSVVKFAGEYKSSDDLYEKIGNAHLRSMPKENTYGAKFNEHRADEDSNTSVVQFLRTQTALSKEDMDTYVQWLTEDINRFFDDVDKNYERKLQLLGIDPTNPTPPANGTAKEKVIWWAFRRGINLNGNAYFEKLVNRKLERILDKMYGGEMYFAPSEHNYQWVLADPIGIFRAMTTGVKMSEEAGKLFEIDPSQYSYNGYAGLKYGEVMNANLKGGKTAVGRWPSSEQNAVQIRENIKGTDDGKVYEELYKQFRLDKDITLHSAIDDIGVHLDMDYDGDTVVSMQGALVKILEHIEEQIKKKNRHGIHARRAALVFPHEVGEKYNLHATSFDGLDFTRRMAEAVRRGLTDPWKLGMYDKYIDLIMSFPDSVIKRMSEWQAVKDQMTLEDFKTVLQARFSTAYILKIDEAKTGIFPKGFEAKLEATKKDILLAADSMVDENGKKIYDIRGMTYENGDGTTQYGNKTSPLLTPGWYANSRNSKKRNQHSRASRWNSSNTIVGDDIDSDLGMPNNLLYATIRAAKKSDVAKKIEADKEALENGSEPNTKKRRGPALDITQLIPYRPETLTFLRNKVDGKALYQVSEDFWRKCMSVYKNTNNISEAVQKVHDMLFSFQHRLQMSNQEFTALMLYGLGQDEYRTNWDTFFSYDQNEIQNRHGAAAAEKNGETYIPPVFGDLGYQLSTKDIIARSVEANAAIADATAQKGHAAFLMREMGKKVEEVYKKLTKQFESKTLGKNVSKEALDNLRTLLAAVKTAVDGKISYAELIQDTENETFDAIEEINNFVKAVLDLDIGKSNPVIGRNIRNLVFDLQTLVTAVTDAEVAYNDAMAILEEYEEFNAKNFFSQPTIPEIFAQVTGTSEDDITVEGIYEYLFNAANATLSQYGLDGVFIRKENNYAEERKASGESQASRREAGERSRVDRRGSNRGDSQRSVVVVEDSVANNTGGRVTGGRVAGRLNNAFIAEGQNDLFLLDEDYDLRDHDTVNGHDIPMSDVMYNYGITSIRCSSTPSDFSALPVLIRVANLFKSPVSFLLGSDFYESNSKDPSKGYKVTLWEGRCIQRRKGGDRTVSIFLKKPQLAIHEIIHALYDYFWDWESQINEDFELAKKVLENNDGLMYLYENIIGRYPGKGVQVHKSEFLAEVMYWAALSPQAEKFGVKKLAEDGAFDFIFQRAEDRGVLKPGGAKELIEMYHQFLGQDNSNIWTDYSLPAPTVKTSPRKAALDAMTERLGQGNQNRLRASIESLDKLFADNKSSLDGLSGVTGVSASKSIGKIIELLKNIHDGFITKDGAKQQEIAVAGLIKEAYATLEDTQYFSTDKTADHLDVRGQLHEALDAVVNNHDGAGALLADAVAQFASHIERVTKLNKATQAYQQEAANASKISSPIVRSLVKWNINPTVALRRLSGWRKDSKLYQLADRIEQAVETRTRLFVQAQNIFASLLEIPGVMDEISKNKVVENEAVRTLLGDIKELEALDLLRQLESISNDRAGKIGDVVRGVRVGDTTMNIKNPADVVIMLRNYVDNNHILKAFDECCNQCFKLLGKEGQKVAKSIYGSAEGYYFNSYSPVRWFSANATEFTDYDRAGWMSLNPRYTKKRSDAASGILQVGSMMTVVENYINAMSEFVGMRELRLDMALMGDRPTGANRKYRSSASLIYIAENALGEEMGKYFQKYINDLNKNHIVEKPGWFDKALRDMQSGILLGNVSVMIKQSASYWNSMGELSPGSLVKAAPRVILGKKLPRTVAYQLQHRKMTGELDPVITSIISSKETDGYLSRMARKSGLFRIIKNGISAVDAATIRALYEATCYEIKSTTGFEVGSKEFLKAVEDKFSKVITHSQPMYAHELRADYARSQDKATKLITMFRTQQTQNFNMILQAFGEYSQSNDKETKKYLKNLLVGQVAAAVSLGAMTVVADMVLHRLDKYRDDEDEDKLSLEKIGERILINSVVAASSTVVFADEIVKKSIDMLPGVDGTESYGLSLGFISNLEDFADTFKTALTSGTPHAWRRAATQAAQMFGIPLGNVYNWLNTMTMYTLDAVGENPHKYDDVFKLLTNEVVISESNAKNILLNAIQKGNEAKADRAYAKMSGDAEEKAEAIRSAAKKRYVEGDLSQPQMENLLAKYVLGDKYDSEKLRGNMLTWTLERETGIKDMEIRKAFIEGDISRMETISYLMNYKGYGMESAAEKVNTYQFEKDHPALEDPSDSFVRNYSNLAQPAGVSAETAYRAWKQYSAMKSIDVDGDGKKDISVQQQFIEYLNTLNLTKEQKQALWLCYYQSLKNCPWK